VGQNQVADLDQPRVRFKAPLTPEPDLSSLAFLKITPKVISVLDYTKGFGHTELVMP
jgi:hypothetical protein